MDDHIGAIPTITVQLYGTIPEQIVQEVRQEIESCYGALPVSLPDAVGLCFFDTLETWRDYTARRRQESGVVTAGEEGFLATHEAWEGPPHLNVCLERLLAQPTLVQHGALHQVVAHSILHGQPEYYRFQIPRTLLAASHSRGVEIEILQQVLYFVAIAVKGHEAVCLLTQHGFIQDQIALAFHQLDVGEDDVILWKMARWEPRARLLYLSAQLKPLLYMQPLLPYAPTLAKAGRSMLAHLPTEDVDRLAALVEIIASERSGDTHHDVQAALALIVHGL